MTTTLIPESAPFNEEQRAWLNGFLSGLMGMPDVAAQAGGVLPGVGAAETEPEEDLDDAAWHDSALPLADRMELAQDKPLPHKLMAAMAQLDCGSCGYLCKTYSGAIASGEETNLTLCSPGGKETKQMLKKLVADAPAATTDASATAGSSTKGWSRSNPFAAKLIESRPLNGEGSAKDTRHVAIDLAESGLKYEVGDALGVYPTNCPELVASICDLLSLNPTSEVSSGGGAKAIAEALADDFCLKDPSDELLELLAAKVESSEAKEKLQELSESGVPDGLDVYEAVEITGGVKITASEFAACLEPLNPRLYSIASSMKEVGEQVHLTVGKVTFERDGREHRGAASCMLTDRLPEGAAVKVFVQPNHGGFTVPADPAIPMIMVGPGTGIAPFMSFLQERQQTKSPGDNWLFFGDQHAASDFLYEDILKQYVADKLITRLDTAFSRDGDAKVYVQNRMQENAAEFWQWLQAGAHIYVCGDASRMAADVDRTLHTIVASQGGMSDEDAAAFVKQLARDKRYVRDVY